MKRWQIYVAVGTIGLLSAWGIHRAFSQRAQQRRDSDYKKVLLSYSSVLKTGMTRKQVEDYLAAQHKPFRQMCCVAVKKFSEGVFDNAYDDLVKIGHENAPWFCSENNVYIAFQFLGSQSNAPSEAASSETLKDLSVYHSLEGCL